MTLQRQAETSSLERDFNVLQQRRMATGATPPLSTTPQAPRPMGFTRQSLQLTLDRGLGLEPNNCPCVRVKKRMLTSNTKVVHTVVVVLMFKQFAFMKMQQSTMLLCK